jgi:sulfite reductase beta subunit-like hemoprotein
VPLGDLDADDLRALSDLADAVGDQHLHLTRNQNVALHHVPLDAVPAVRARLRVIGLDSRAPISPPTCASAPADRSAAWRSLPRRRWARSC